MNNILAALDFSPVTAQLLKHAAAVSAPGRGKIWLVHVAPPEPDFVGFKTGPQYVRDHLAERLRKEHADLQRMAADLRGSGHDAEALMVQGPAAETILQEAERLQADAIIIGSHGHGALFRAIVGSVSEQVLRASRIPVLVVPMPRDH